ncbi:hypothetical protein FA15DRAFT_721203 [Coprinopsis marcescibilis]|uniref:Fungal-type protein kinase domain-containing protein n=1 Tax=Coprinopsis marcescibilis TaxID=230819 RepID=A0A5C3KJ01_COPMA|nr:hypothetical protein FA15DRAFT_721203 [Coprinopsis marcescibilis]
MYPSDDKINLPSSSPGTTREPLDIIGHEDDRGSAEEQTQFCHWKKSDKRQQFIWNLCMDDSMSQKELTNMMINVIKDMLARFEDRQPPTDPSLQQCVQIRYVYPMDRQGFVLPENEESRHKDILITGSGTCFPLIGSDTPPSYEAALLILHVCCDSDCFNIFENLRQLDIYSRVLLSLTSSDPDIVGFDQTITWGSIVNKDGESTLQGKLVSLGADGNPAEYTIVGTRPVYYQLLKMPGTTPLGWHVVDKDGRRLFAKEVWPQVETSIEQQEYNLLDVAKQHKLEGVGQIVCYEQLCSTVKLYNRIMHCYTYVSGAEVDRIKMQMIMTDHREPLRGLQTAHQALGALDISWGNVLMGDSSAGDRQWGALIDLDAAYCMPQKNDFPVAVYMGTIPFMSISVVESKHRDVNEAYHHDYLDDLELFFHLFCILAFTLAGPETDRKDQNAAEAMRTVIHSKGLSEKDLEQLISDFWGAPCRKLFTAWKERINWGHNSYKRRKAFWNSSQKHYSTVLGFLKKEIEALEHPMDEKSGSSRIAAGDNAATLPQIPAGQRGEKKTSPQPRAQSATRSTKPLKPSEPSALKRRAEDPQPQVTPPIKRLCKTREVAEDLSNSLAVLKSIQAPPGVRSSARLFSNPSTKDRLKNGSLKK